MMSVNGVILYEKVRRGTKYLLQLSLLLSSFTHCYYTGLSVMWWTLLHSSLYVVFFFLFFPERCITCVYCWVMEQMLSVHIWYLRYLKPSGMKEFLMLHLLMMCYTKWVLFGHIIMNITSNCYIGIAVCRNLTLSDRLALCYSATGY